MWPELKTFSGRRASQNAAELGGFIDLLRREGVTRYLEIGARHGDTFHEIMCALPAGSVGLAVDLPGGLWGTSASRAALTRAIDDLQSRGISAHCMFTDSQNREHAEAIIATGPYDAILIDGDHTYAGVSRDWQLYGDQARLIAFHDIVGTGQIERVGGRPVEVPQLWAELRERYPRQEIVDDGSKMGIGVLWTSR